jgi:hypothetical protein
MDGGQIAETNGVTQARCTNRHQPTAADTSYLDVQTIRVAADNRV